MLQASACSASFNQQQALCWFKVRSFVCYNKRILPTFWSALEKQRQPKCSKYAALGLNRMINLRIQDFIDECQSAYACYTFCIAGMEKQAEQFEPHLKANPLAKIHISDTDPNLKRPTATMALSDLTAKLKKDSEYSSTVAKFLLVFLYSRWDEYHRALIAKSLGKKTKDVRCDLMGDLREIRNCIVHDKSIISQEQINKLKCIHWAPSPGELRVSAEMMKLFIEQTHFMQKYIAEGST